MNANYAPTPKKRVPRLPIVAALVGMLCALGAVLALAGYYFLAPEEISTPLVLIREPQHGDPLDLDERVTVRALARDENNLTRIEFWDNDQLLHAQTSEMPGGISPLPLLYTWQPKTPGTHTLVVRAFNTQDQRSQASIDVDVAETPDQDNDNVPDVDDACPDVAGNATAAGCPDRDVDGVADAADACPEHAGPSTEDGCPVAAADDRDGDSVLDAEDSCPDEPGSPLTEGCATPGDSDGDGFLDEDDMCPTEAGTEATWGCPDGDGDGVRDSEDLCPAEPGPPENRGCPVADEGGLLPEGADPGLDIPDSDGDGMSDDADPCPHEAGSAEDGYCPPPEPGAPEDDDDLPGPFPEGGDWETVYSVEFDALSFEVTSDEYEWVWCYIEAGEAGWENYRFEPSGVRRWNLEEQFGGENSRTFWLGADEQMPVSLQCWGWPGSPPSHYLGIQMNQHGREDWQGQVHTMHSEEGDDGHAFTATYRLCTPSCDEAGFLPPLIHTQYYWLGRQRLVWAWEGNPDDITGYMIYIDGARAEYTANNYIEIDEYLPACGETREIEVTAALVSPTEITESPHSNTWLLEGEPCPRYARVTFQAIRTYDLPLDSGFEYCQYSLGPLDGSLWVSGSETVSLPLNTSYRARSWNYLSGVCLHPDQTRAVADIVAACNDLPYPALPASSTEASLIHCPESHVVEVLLGDGDALSFGGTFTESDRNGSWGWIYNGEFTLPPPPEDAVGGTYTISDELGYMDLIVEVELRPAVVIPGP